MLHLESNLLNTGPDILDLLFRMRFQSLLTTIKSTGTTSWRNTHKNRINQVRLKAHKSAPVDCPF